MKFSMCLCDWSCNYLALSFLTNFCGLNLSTTETELLWDSVHGYVIYWGCVLRYLHELNCYGFQVNYFITHWSSCSNEIHIALQFSCSQNCMNILPPHLSILKPQSLCFIYIYWFYIVGLLYFKLWIQCALIISIPLSSATSSTS